MFATIVSVGTELTNGQILNRNSTWISQQLKNLGLQTRLHLVVPDDRDLILEGLKYAGERGDLVFVTGGLGPTSDDFTRDLIAEWVGQPLEFDQASWDHVNKRLSDRKIEIRESQRQQCYFPKGATVLPNSEGTANGFQLKLGDKDVFVLPGPPREIEVVWTASIAAFLEKKTRGLDKYLTFVWDTIGVGESDVSHLTENCLQGVKIEKGYRVHLPYVEVKVSFYESQKAEMMPWVQKLDEVLKNITVTRNEEDLALLLAKYLKEVSHIHVVDSFSGGVLLNRLAPAWKSLWSEKTWSFSSERADLLPDPRTLTLLLEPVGTTEASAEFHYMGAAFKDHFHAPQIMSKMRERRALYYSERALIFWLRQAQFFFN